jgi:hypothetical protein
MITILLTIVFVIVFVLLGSGLCWLLGWLLGVFNPVGYQGHRPWAAEVKEAKEHRRQQRAKYGF